MMVTAYNYDYVVVVVVVDDDDVLRCTWSVLEYIEGQIYT